MGNWFASREEVIESLEFGDVAVINRVVDSALEAASRGIELSLHRRFFPTIGTFYFDWPNSGSTSSYRLWLGLNELISITSLTTDNGTTTLAPGTYFVRSSDDSIIPPYDQVQVNTGTSGTFSAGSTFQKAVGITGLFGYSDDSSPAGTITSGIADAVTTTILVSNSYAIGVGSIIKIDTERLTCTAKSWVDSTQNIGANQAADLADTAMAVTNGAAFNVGELLLVGTEKQKITDIAGNTLIVERAVQGSVLAAHTSGTDIFVPRSLTVVRGSLGTTAAAHNSASVITRYEAPGPIKELCIAEAINTTLQKAAGYARVIGSGENARNASGFGIEDLRRSVDMQYGRHARLWSV